MLGVPAFSRVAMGDPRNGAVNTFLQAMRDLSGVVPLNGRDPVDVAAANGGQRARNIRAQNQACSQLVQAVQC